MKTRNERILMKSFFLPESYLGLGGTPRFQKCGKPTENGGFGQEEPSSRTGETRGALAPDQPAGGGEKTPRPLPKCAGARPSPVSCPGAPPAEGDGAEGLAGLPLC